MNDHDYRKAFVRWFRQFPERDADLALIPFLNIERNSIHRGGWLRAARRAHFLSTGQMAERLGMSRAAYVKFESRDREGLVSIAKLNDLAHAMNCEVIYALRPKNRQRFSVNIWRILLRTALQHNWVQSRPEFRKSLALASVAQDQMKLPSLRQFHGWSKRVKN